MIFRDEQGRLYEGVCLLSDDGSKLALINNRLAVDAVTDIDQPLTNEQLRSSPVDVINIEGTLISESCTETPLQASQTFVADAANCLDFGQITVSLLTDQDGILFVEFSPDGTNWDSSISLKITANKNEVHRYTRTREFFRIRVSNTSQNNQSFLRVQVIGGVSNLLTSALNSEVQSDADTLVVREIDFNLMVANNLYQNHTPTIKDGISQTISTGTVPRDLDNATSTVYAGFPALAAPAEIVVASSSDIGIVRYAYMASDTDTDYTFGSIQINGAGTYSLGHNIWRCNYAIYSGTSRNINAGNITIRQSSPNTSVVFCRIDAGIGQSYCAAYTVPYGSKVFLDRLSGSVRGGVSGSLEGYLYYKPYNESPYLRFPFELQFGGLYFDDIDFLVVIPERVDFIPRITASSGNGLFAKMSCRFVKVKS